MSTLFISDLHLQSERPHITRAFFDFIDHQATGADALYILGDFFNLWLDDRVRNELTDQVASKLKRLSDNGTRVYLMHGNRDFLIGKRYCRQAGATLIDDPLTIDLYGTPALLMHGDSLCLADESYQRYRKIIRGPLVNLLKYVVPLSFKQRIARKIKSKSREAKSYKSAMIMDVTRDEADRQLQQHQLQLLIHGHTHRPAVHQFELNQHPCQRIVLGDWEQQGWYLRWERDGEHSLQSFPIAMD